MSRRERTSEGATSTSHVFSKEVAAEVRRIELRTRGLVESLFGGEYLSVFKGRGLEFADVREYQPGDDTRAIDWNVTARRGQLFMKEYVEERELTVLLVVDLSASKRFGTGAKSNALIASEIAAILSFAATRNNDRVGLLLVTDRVELFIPPDSGRRHVMRMALELLSFQPTGRGTRLSAALEYASRVLRRRSAVFLLSDFLFDEVTDPEFRRAAGLLAREHDLVPLRLTDPGASALPDVGLLVLVDPETGRRHVVDTSSRRFRTGYAEAQLEQRAALTSIFQDLHLDVIEVDTARDPVPALVGFFRQRERASR